MKLNSTSQNKLDKLDLERGGLKKCIKSCSLQLNQDQFACTIAILFMLRRILIPLSSTT